MKSFFMRKIQWFFWKFSSRLILKSSSGSIFPLMSFFIIGTSCKLHIFALMFLLNFSSNFSRTYGVTFEAVLIGKGRGGPRRIQLVVDPKLRSLNLNTAHSSITSKISTKSPQSFSVQVDCVCWVYCWNFVERCKRVESIITTNKISARR